MLKASGIHKSFGEQHILKGVDVGITPGAITCMIGPSGCGKTTLLRALAMLDYPDRGRVEIDSKSYDFPLPKNGHEPAPWPGVTAVFQSLFLWPHLTLRENIMLPARNCNDKAGEDIEGLINIFEMEHFIDNYPNQASVGQRQRVAVARALILNPRYLFLDEITSALDIEQSARILTKLEHLKERGIGVFMITHAMGFARRAADEVIFMECGKIVEQGPPKILDKPKSKRLQTFLSLADIAA
jgi:ABC-type polar amino acid transport system ATPase subunit